MYFDVFNNSDSASIKRQIWKQLVRHFFCGGAL